MDGVDVAVVKVGRGRGGRLRAKVLSQLSCPYPRRLRKRLAEAVAEAPLAAIDWASLSADVARAFAVAAGRGLAAAGLHPGHCDAVASHGQTIAHRPGRPTLSLQIGEPAIIAEQTATTVVSDFRAADLAAGGQGAPLAPYAHAWMFAGRRRCGVVNLGGMGNLSLLDPTGGGVVVAGSDSGPGNVLIDAAMQIVSVGRRKIDRGGRYARGGQVDEALVARVLDQPFFRRRLPTSTGREEFSPRLAASLVAWARRRGLDDRSIVASLTMATARSVARACRLLGGHRLEELLVCGGGALNATLMAMLAEQLPGLKVASTATAGFDPRFVEAVAFALFGYLCLEASAANVPAVTGAAGPRVLGKISPGPNYGGSALRPRRGRGGAGRGRALRPSRG